MNLTYLNESGYPPYDDETGWVPGGPGPDGK